MDKCARCFRAGDTIGDCGYHKTGCPPVKKIDPIRDVLVDCRHCDKLLAIPIGKIMKGKVRALTGRCTSDNCKAVIVRPATKKGATSDGTKETEA